MGKNKLVIILIITLLIIMAIGAIFFASKLRYQKSTEKLQLLNDYSLDGDHPAPDSNDKPR